MKYLCPKKNAAVTGRRKYAVFGNCQAPIIAEFLETSPKFKSMFEKIGLLAVHEISPQQMEDFKKNLSTLSLFIYQNVKRVNFDTNSILAILPKECIKISIPSLFFNAYNPEVTYIRESQASINYHDRLQLKLIGDYDSFEKVLLDSTDFYPKAFSERCLELSIAELQRRETEQGIHVPMSDYIASGFRDERLFHVLNHPSQELLRVLCMRILKYLGFAPNVDQCVDGYNLDRWQFPIYRSHFCNLGLKFDNTDNYVWNGGVYTPKEFFDRQMKYYSTIPTGLLNEQNFEFVNPMLRVWDLAAEFDYPKTDIGAQ